MAALRIGTRASALALTQSRHVAELLAPHAGDEVELVPITTSGDEEASRPAPPTDKSRFVKEIEEALLDGRVDLAVHSAKDVPGELFDGLSIVGVPPRADPRDALVGVASLGDLPSGARVGTASLRRRALLLALRPDIFVGDLRGNVTTRLERLSRGEWDAIVLAAAGLERLGVAGGSPLAAETVTPAPGQGCLALEARSDDERVATLAGAVTDHAALVCLTAERALVARLGATCRTPVGAHAALDGETLRLHAFAGRPDGSAWVRDTLEGDASDPSTLGMSVGTRMLAAGAAEILAQAEIDD